VQTGTITNNGDTVTLALPQGGYSSFGIQVSGTWSGAMQVKGSVINCTNASVTTSLPLSNGISSGSVSTNGNYQGNAASLKCIQITGLSMASGTANITMSAGAGVGPIMQDNTPWVIGGFATGASTSGIAATVKSASTAPATTDTTLVTGIADGNNVTLGSKADAATCATTNTAIACLRQIDADVKGPIPTQASTVPIGGVSALAAASGGATPSLQGALSTTVQSIKSSAGSLYMVLCYNPNATVEYVQVFNIASGSVTLGSSTPLMSIPVPATQNGGWSMSAVPAAFGTAMSWAATTTFNGSTAPGTGLTCNALYN
jgi:hypothetical protein